MLVSIGRSDGTREELKRKNGDEGGEGRWVPREEVDGAYRGAQQCAVAYHPGVLDGASTWYQRKTTEEEAATTDGYLTVERSEAAEVGGGDEAHKCPGDVNGRREREERE